MKRKITAILLLVCMLCSIVPINALVGASDNVGTFDTTEEKVYAVEENPIEDSISNDNISETSSVQNESENITTENDLGDSSELQNADDIEESDIQENEERQEAVTESDETMISNQYNIDNQVAIQSDEESEEPENDNWELGLVFYDSSVDNGKTPLTEIDWDASDGGYGHGETRVITVQINYKNTNAATTYQPGEIEISVPNLIYNTSSNTDNSPFWNSSVVVGANDSSHKGYEWDFKTTDIAINQQEIYYFNNTNIIEEKSNFQGNIQIIYTIEPNGENTSTTLEPFDDECIHVLNKTLKAQIKYNELEIKNKEIYSNEAIFNYYRKYMHPWKRTQYNVYEQALKLNSYDGLPSNSSEYIWVKYRISHNNVLENRINFYTIQAYNGFYKWVFPKGIIVYNSNFELLSPNDKWEYQISAPVFPYTLYNTYEYIYVGYPKSEYNEENGNLNITNEVELYGKYQNKQHHELLNTTQLSINLADFEFMYSGDLYGIKKYPYDFSKLRYQDIINQNGINYAKWYINPTAIYTGKKMTIKIGDDILFCTSQDSSYKKLRDNEYYFDNITFNSGRFINGNGQKILDDKYDCQLYIRYKDKNDYILYESFKNKYKNWKFSEKDGVVSFYFVVHDMEESLTAQSSNSTPGRVPGLIEAKTVLIKSDIPETGYIYNFDYLQVFIKDDDGNFIMQNEPQIDSYNNLLTKEEIAQYDKDIYGVYLQRSTANYKWEYYNVLQPSNKITATKNSGQIIQDENKKQFIIPFSIGANLRPDYGSSGVIDKKYIEQYDKSYALQGFELYDLLPYDMKLISTEKEIANSFSTKYISNGTTVSIYDLDGNLINNKEIISYINPIHEITITDNWKNTGRTKINIKCTFQKPIYITQNQGAVTFNYTYDSYVTYDSFLEYGNVWTNYCYVDKLYKQNGIKFRNDVIDNGVYDIDAIDIDGDGDTKDKLSYSKGTATIMSVISTHQDVQKSVKTDQSNYSTGTVKSSYDSEYEYKLRVRTGQNDITNLVIYDSIEEYAQNPDGDIVPAYGSKKHWNGEFLGVDTSYAESKGYKVKVYYSDDIKAGNLSDDNSWKEYSEAVDRTKVKSLAFEYLDSEGNPAKLPANSLTYILIKMKSPADENITTLAYNGCRTQWNALDDYDKPVDFITGINSNIVKVSLPNSVEDKEVNLHFNKIISSENEAFEKLKLNKDDSYNFFITLENQNTGDIIKGTVNNKDGFTVNNVPIGTYIIKELDDIWFKFVSMALNESIDGIEFEEADGDYIIIINASVEAGVTANIDITNKTDEERFYDNKHDVKNLFNPTT